MKMIARIVSKKETWEMIKALRDAGFPVQKLAVGYQLVEDDVTLFKATNGSNGYLVRMAEDLFLYSLATAILID